jgi:hypothetical protein
MRDSSLKLGSYSKKERFLLVVKDFLTWKTVLFSLLTSLTFASTCLLFVLGVLTMCKIQTTNDPQHIGMISTILVIAISFPIGMFAEFLFAESENSTIAEFSAECIKHDLYVMSIMNPYAVFIRIPISILRFLLVTARRKSSQEIA